RSAHARGHPHRLLRGRDLRGAGPAHGCAAGDGEELDPPRPRPAERVSGAMSEDAELAGLEALAAEHALGVLSARDRAEAEARMAHGPAFAQLVEAWRAGLAPMLETAPAAEPGAAVWSRIERVLPANDNAAMRRRLRFWRGAAMGSMGLAAASLALAV